MTEAVTTTPATTDSAPAASTPAVSQAATQASVPAVAAGPAATSTVDPGTVSQADSQTQQQPAAPEKYEFVIPDGKKIDPSLQGDIESLAKELKLPQDQAQKLIDLALKNQADPAAQVKAVSAQWLSELPSDPEIGGDKVKENIATAQRALATFGTPALKEMLEKTGLGNHPELIRAFYRVGLKVSPDNQLVTGAQGEQKRPSSPAAALYPSMSKTV